MEERKDIKKVPANHMEYLPDMEILEDSDLMERVLKATEEYHPERFTEEDVRAALGKDTLSPYDFGALLSPAAQPFLEEMAQRAQLETRKHFGNCLLYTSSSDLPMSMRENTETRSVNGSILSLSAVPETNTRK